MDPNNDPIFNQDGDSTEEEDIHDGVNVWIGPYEEPNTVIMPLHGFILASLLGNIVQPLPVWRSVAQIAPPSPLTSEEDEPVSRNLVRYRDDSAEEQPAAKVPKHELIIHYTYVKLNTHVKIRFKENDGKNVLVTENEVPNLFVRKILSKVPRSIKARMHFLNKFMQNNAEYDEYDEYDDDCEEENSDMDGKAALLYNLKDQMISAYIKECKLRATFRKVLQRWRVYKMDQRFKQEERELDPITLAPPEKEVYLYDWSARKKFVFDAKSLATLIESKLLYNEGGFAVPMNPCNPWTNVEFNYQQLVSIYNQLKEHGELRWGLITLRQYNFVKNTWHKYHSSALTMSAIKNSLIRLDSFDARELLADFIFSKLEELQLRCSSYVENAYRTDRKSVV